MIQVTKVNQVTMGWVSMVVREEAERKNSCFHVPPNYLLVLPFLTHLTLKIRCLVQKDGTSLFWISFILSLSVPSIQTSLSS